MVPSRKPEQTKVTKSNSPLTFHISFHSWTFCIYCRYLSHYQLETCKFSSQPFMQLLETCHMFEPNNRTKIAMAHLCASIVQLKGVVIQVNVCILLMLTKAGAGTLLAHKHKNILYKFKLYGTFITVKQAATFDTEMQP